jgi:glycosyltransferase involved in cell wall biosynthesis
VSTPDVTVVVPVYNTMPYLNACLDSLVDQSIGHDRLQVVAVDDGSTDGSGVLLDDYARRYPDVFVVLHQANSGGPAGPCNVGLEHATGRYVFFLGGDDHLGEEALARMVTKADEWESDVVAVKLVGTNGREIGQELFRANEKDLPFPDQRAFITANTKLFRRSLLERHAIRYLEHIRIASDQTFTIEAMYRGRRTSVLSDYDYYYAVLRDDASNLMYQPHFNERLDAIEATMEYIAGLIDSDEVRDAVLYRHLKWEYANRLRSDLPYLDEAAQEALVRRVGAAADRYLTDRISSMLNVPRRLRLNLAQAGDVGAIRRLNEFQAAGERALVLVDGNRFYLALPGYAEPGMPRQWFEITDEHERSSSLAWYTRWLATSVAWKGTDLIVEAHSAWASGRPPAMSARLTDAGYQAAVPVALEDTPAPDGGTQVRLTVDGAAFLATAPARERWRLVVDTDLPGFSSQPVRVDELRARTTVDGGVERHTLVARGNRNGRLVLLHDP